MKKAFRIIMAAGSTIAHEEPPDPLAFGRAVQVNGEGRASVIRRRHEAK